MSSKKEITFRPSPVETDSPLDWELSTYEALLNLPREAWNDEHYQLVARGSPMAWLYSLICSLAKHIANKTEAESPQFVRDALNSPRSDINHH